MLAYVTGSVDEELLRRNEYLVAENRILRAHIRGRVNLSDGERRTLAQIGKRLGRKALAEIASVVGPETILAWHRRLVAKKFDGSKKRTSPGRPSVDGKIEQRMSGSPPTTADWGYDRIAGALANLGDAVSDQTVGNILKRYGIPPAPARQAHDVERFHSRPPGLPRRPSVSDSRSRRQVLPRVRRGVRDGGARPVRLPPRSPNLNAYAERWVRSVKDECLAKLILVGEPALRTALRAYVEHFHGERNHQGKGQPPPLSVRGDGARTGPCDAASGLGGLLKFYYRPAA